MPEIFQKELNFDSNNKSSSRDNLNKETKKKC
jgi:hypothetical protein